MAEFKSHYQSLGFYANEEFKKFTGGRFITEDAATIEVLENLSDVQRVDEPTSQKAPAKRNTTVKKPAKRNTTVKKPAKEA